MFQGNASGEFAAYKLSNFLVVLKEGPSQAQGMPKYDDLTDDEIRQIHMFIRQRARKDVGKATSPN